MSRTETGIRKFVFVIMPFLTINLYIFKDIKVLLAELCLLNEYYHFEICISLFYLMSFAQNLHENLKDFDLIENLKKFKLTQKVLTGRENED